MILVNNTINPKVIDLSVEESGEYKLPKTIDLPEMIDLSVDLALDKSESDLYAIEIEEEQTEKKKKEEEDAVMQKLFGKSVPKVYIEEDVACGITVEYLSELEKRLAHMIERVTEVGEELASLMAHHKQSKK